MSPSVFDWIQRLVLGKVHTLIGVQMTAQTVFEFVFENGILKSMNDRSEKAAEIRDLVLRESENGDGRKPDDEEVRSFIEAAFDRSYQI